MPSAPQGSERDQVRPTARPPRRLDASRHDPDGSKIINAALNLLARHGVARQTATAALLGVLNGQATALRVHNVSDPKALLENLSAMGFPGKRLKAPPKRKLIEAWATDDPDMAARLKITGTPLAPTLVQEVIRRELSLSQAQFAERYGIPVHCIRAWEIRRSVTEAATLAYLEAIAEDPPRDWRRLMQPQRQRRPGRWRRQGDKAGTEGRSIGVHGPTFFF